MRALGVWLVQVAETGRGPEHQIPSMGCTIKWKAASAGPEGRRSRMGALGVWLVQVAETGRGPEHQTPSMGCTIKWKAA
jgi:hypothetical protein